MSINQENLKPLLEMLGTDLTRQFVIAYVFWALVFFLVLLYLIKKLTRWPVLVSLTVLIFASIISMIVSIPFEIPRMLFIKISHFDAQSRTVKLLLCVLIMVWEILIRALSFQLALKMITYFDRKRTYNFGLRLFLYLCALEALHILFTLSCFISYCSYDIKLFLKIKGQL